MEGSHCYPFIYVKSQKKDEKHIQIKTESFWDHSDYNSERFKCDMDANVKCEIVKEEQEEKLCVDNLSRKNFNTDNEDYNHENDMFPYQENAILDKKQMSLIPEIHDKLSEKKIFAIKCEPGSEEKSSHCTIIKKETLENENSPEVRLADEVKKENDSREPKLKLRFPCGLCSKTFSATKSLKCHVAVVHNNERPFQCQICLKSFGRKSFLKEHENYHTGENVFKCKICSKTFAKKSVLKVHLEGHVKRFQCKYCLETFTRKTQLVKHERSHNDKPFQCEICSKDFALKIYLIEHTRTHSGEKPYACKICSKKFFRNSHCRRHEKSHSGDKPFQCKLCQKTFSRNSHLVEHERTHTGEKPYQCTFCEKCFSRQSNRNMHEKTHYEIKPYECHICNKAFAQSCDLTKHEKSHVKEKKRLSKVEKVK
nr:zinc finger protein OZF-like [Leptinotarsa decemlineata]